MIPKETVDRILESARIEEVVGDFVSLKRRGGEYIACCPFHNEKTPSFHVRPAHGYYHCFGCGKSGSAVGFLMDYERMSYVEAIRYLARKYHIEVVEKEETAEEIAARQHSESLMLVSDFAGKFFSEQLGSPEGKAIGLSYFRSRGLEDETIRKYGLGWAPKSKSAFTEAARAAGYKKEFLVETGLCAEWDDGSLHDRFYERVMFPIHSVSGRVIAFGGRTLLTDKNAPVAKYVNSKESEIYVKSRSLYGIWFAKNEIARREKCYLVEGYLDVLSLHQLGITNAVASSGTSLTEEQVRLIKRFTDNVTVIYDGDAAGLNAAVRAVGLILKEGLNARVVFLPDGDDPDSYARKHTLEEVRGYIDAHEQDGIGFKTELLLSEAGNDPLKRAGLINEIADTVALIPDAIKRNVYVDLCSRKFNVDAQDFFARIRKTRERLLEEERAAVERERRARYAPAGPDSPHVAGPPGGDAPAEKTAPDGPGQSQSPPASLQSVENDALLAPCERELLSFVLTHGRSPLEFETDSEFYSDDPPTVADFIDDSLSVDALDFANTAYRKVYEHYFARYDEGLDQAQILRALLDDPDRTTAFVAAQLSEERYLLTVEGFRASLMTRASWLVTYVPRAILAYKDKRMQAEALSLTRRLSAAGPEEQEELMRRISWCNQARQRLKERLGREKK